PSIKGTKKKRNQYKRRDVNVRKICFLLRALVRRAERCELCVHVFPLDAELFAVPRDVRVYDPRDRFGSAAPHYISSIALGAAVFGMLLQCEGSTKRQRTVRTLGCRPEITLYTAGDKSMCSSRTTRSGRAFARQSTCSARCKALQCKRSVTAVAEAVPVRLVQDHVACERRGGRKT
ncbi:hypothetical protein JG688_00017406, partial [Phytophthora aleatoria]